MSQGVRVSRDGVFLRGPAPFCEVGVVRVQDISDFNQLDKLLTQPAVRLTIAGFADGRAFSLARQLRLRGFAGPVELVGDIVPDQLPMAVAAGIDVVEISEAHAARCQEPQWRDKATKPRFGYQRDLGRVERPV
jgi:uncharacterized protein (DUF934 family)